MPPPHLIYICSNQSHDQTVWVSGEVRISKCLGDQGPTFRPINQPPTGLQDLWNLHFLEKGYQLYFFSLSFWDFWRLLRPDGGLFLGSKYAPWSPLRYGITRLKIGVVVVVWDLLLWILFIMPPPHLIYIWSNQSHDETVWPVLTWINLT